ncbi:MAG: hypothetical protein BGO39_08165 [Chloroflexi bacterium 54-19]|nr:MAG: hypothetical protein BGO39_08165 [Chloroflexi bacterium 54-19]
MFLTFLTLLSLLVAACGDLTPTALQPTPVAQTNALNTPTNSSGGTTSAAALTPATQPATSATITPPVYSGLQKGQLKEMYPVLAGLVEAKSFRINDDWSGLSIYPGADKQLAHYSVVRQPNGFEGQAFFSKGYFYSINQRQDPNYKEISKVINIPLDVARKFLQTLAEAPVYVGDYNGSPIATHTDDYPSLKIYIDTGSGTLGVVSNSQQDNFYPWAFIFAGRLFTGTDATAFEAFQLLKPYLQKDVLEDMLKSARDNYTPNATPNLTPNPGLTPAPTNSGSNLASLVTPGFSVLSQPGHLGSIRNVTVSPDGQIFATAGDESDRTVRLWDKNGQLLKVLNGHTSNVGGLSFSPDGKMLASSGREIIIWEVSNGKQLANFDLNGDQASLLSFSTDGKTLVSSDNISSRQVRLWDVSAYKFLFSLEGTNAIVLPGSSTIIYSDRQIIKLMDLTSHQTTLYRDDILSFHGIFSISPDGKTLALENSANDIELYEVPSGKKLKTLSTSLPKTEDLFFEQIFYLVFSPDGKYLAASRTGNTTVEVWQESDGKEVTIVTADKSYFLPIAFSADSQRLYITGTSISGWDLQGKQIFKNANSGSKINALALSPDGKTFVTGTQGKEVKLWDSANGNLITTFTGSQSEIFAVAYSPDGRLVAGTGGVSYYPDTDNAIRLWDTTTKNAAPILTLTGHFEPVQALAFSPDGKQLASGSYDRTIRLWDLSTGKQTAEFKGKVPEYFRFYTLAFSPDGKMLAGAGSGDPDSKDFPVKVWDIATGQGIASLQGHTGNVLTLAFSPDGKTLASGSEDGSVRLWDIAGKKELARLDSKAGKGIVYSVAFSPEGKSLAVSYQNGLLALWDTVTHQEISNTIAQSYSGAFYLAFSPDGRFLITGHQQDTALKRWQIK